MKADKKEANRLRQCVAIAKDALTQVLAHKYRATRGIYLNLYMDVLPDMDLQAQLRKHEKENPERITCACCARGAMFISAVRKFDGYTPESYSRRISSSDMVGLKEFFPQMQLRDMEAFFEKWLHERNAVCSKGCSRCTSQRVMSVMNRLTDDESLIAICRNIIRNGGEFKLSTILVRDARETECQKPPRRARA